jgi:hypothetical protein
MWEAGGKYFDLAIAVLGKPKLYLLILHLKLPQPRFYTVRDLQRARPYSSLDTASSELAAWNKAGYTSVRYISFTDEIILIIFRYGDTHG